MKDLKKMREDFEKEYARQEMANNLEEKYGEGCEFYIYERHPKHGGYRISAHDGRGLRNKPISLAHARALLVDFPADKEQILNDTASGQKEPVYGLYRVCVQIVAILTHSQSLVYHGSQVATSTISLSR